MKKIIFLIIFIFSFFNISYGAESVIYSPENKKTNLMDVVGNIFSRDFVISLVLALFTILLTFFISKIIREKLFNYLEKKVSENESGVEIVGVITRTVNIIILVSGFSISLGILGVDLTIFVGGIGFGIGFTLKTFLTNFIAGIIMITQNTYHNGDLIEIGGDMGVITKINTLFTSVEKFNGVVFYVPNIKFIEEKVLNFYSNDKRRTDVEFLLEYDTDIYNVKSIINKVIENFPTILRSPKHDVLIEKLEQNGILLKLRFWMGSKENYFELKSNITETLNLAFTQYGIKIASPNIRINNISSNEIISNMNIVKKK